MEWARAKTDDQNDGSGCAGIYVSGLGFECSAVQRCPCSSPIVAKNTVSTPNSPPVAVYHAQREEAEAPPAPPPVNLYHLQREQQNKETGLVRPLERELDIPYNQLPDSSLLENIIYDLQSSGGLTALKDEDLQVCFIDHFVRPFIVPREQRRFYTHALSSTLAENEDDHKAFKSMVGQHIYDLCRGIRTYWLDSRLLFEYETTCSPLPEPEACLLLLAPPVASGRHPPLPCIVHWPRSHRYPYTLHHPLCLPLQPRR
ncbi:uncharacterized protein LOC112575777 [Pomacea canaliculata]|uniref:uncharacterized protein LOC112575777 n=1 Tax=Pomacea canaliculata TaxID=400727 RepID=UPI000D73AAE7|nr:uncharacterized protein LOC112575777 [Pomacea canaliculata]